MDSTCATFGTTLMCLHLSESMHLKIKFLCVIHDKMDCAKTTLQRLVMANKMICRLGQLPITLMGMIAHGHGDERYAQYSIESWLNDPNFMIESLLQLL